MYKNLSSVLDEIGEDLPLDTPLKTDIIQHLRALESEIKRYFRELRKKDEKLAGKSLSGILDAAAILG